MNHDDDVKSNKRIKTDPTQDLLDTIASLVKSCGLTQDEIRLRLRGYGFCSDCYRSYQCQCHEKKTLAISQMLNDHLPSVWTGLVCEYAQPILVQIVHGKDEQLDSSAEMFRLGHHYNLKYNRRYPHTFDNMAYTFDTMDRYSRLSMSEREHGPIITSSSHGKVHHASIWLFTCGEDEKEEKEKEKDEEKGEEGKYTLEYKFELKTDRVLCAFEWCGYEEWMVVVFDHSGDMKMGTFKDDNLTWSPSIPISYLGLGRLQSNGMDYDRIQIKQQERQIIVYSCADDRQVRFEIPFDVFTNREDIQLQIRGGLSSHTSEECDYQNVILCLSSALLSPEVLESMKINGMFRMFPQFSGFWF